jgi:predicted metalloprotease
MRIGLPVGGGIGGIVLLLLISALTGTNPVDLINGGAPQDDTVGTTGVRDDDPQAEFVSVVLADTEETWRGIFSSRSTYQPPTLVLFTYATESACGLGQSAMGPFYCPADRKVYLDLSFFNELETRFGAPGDFAQAYVVAHEVGHHVQTLTGLSSRVMAARERARSEREANALSVRQELQADCYAGVWGHYAARRGLLEPGDAEEGLNAAAAIGDDRLQRRGQGHVVPETFTHGSSEERMRWLERGMNAGRMEACDTFAPET